MPSSISEIQELFKVSQEGSMNVANARGISLESLMASLMFSTIYCCLQLSLFYYLQGKYPQFYDKYGNDNITSNGGENIYGIDNIDSKPLASSSKMSVLSFCLFQVRKKNDIVKFLDIEEYRKYGLDSYLFLRFLRVCLYFFVGISLVCLPILIPINYLTETSDTDNYSGLDLISILNINANSTYKYIFHFLVTIFIVFWFHYILNHEINFFIQLKYDFFSNYVKYDTGKRFCNTMYFGNIDTRKLHTIGELKICLEKLIPNSIDHIYPIYHSKKLNRLFKKYQKLKIELERHYNEVWKFQNGLRKGMPKNIMYIPIRLLNSDFEITIVGLSYKVHKCQYLKEEMRILKREINKIRSIYWTNESLDDPILLNNKVFIVFKYRPYTQILNQAELDIGNVKMIDINPRDIIWDKLDFNENNDNFFNNVKEILYFIISIIVIVCWVIPISCVGTISQLNCLTILIPTMRWINLIPQGLQDFISWVLPNIVLTFLTSFALIIFRYLSNKKGYLTGASIEMSIQQWVFIFLFFQLFIVITISSGFIVVLQKLLVNPISIPMILAIDFPKASIFFTLFFILRGLTLLGNNVLQFYYFVKNCFIEDKFLKRGKTENELKMEKLGKLYDFGNYWGQIYPTFSVYGCIGIVYSIISPVILIFCCINFTLDLIGYKYSIKYSLNRTNKSETYGKMYITALKQMYAGIYSLEIFDIGLFFSIKDSNDERSCIVLCVLMLVVLGITVYEHINLNREYRRGVESVCLGEGGYEKEMLSHTGRRVYLEKSLYEGL